MTFVYGGNTVTFDAVLFPAQYEATRHQNFGESGDGTVRVYDRSAKTELIHLNIKDDHDNLTDIREFIMDTVKMKLYAFTFNPDTGHDVGNGDAGAITVRYWSSNFMEDQYTYHRYRYTLTLRREVS